MLLILFLVGIVNAYLEDNAPWWVDWILVFFSICVTRSLIGSVGPEGQPAWVDSPYDDIAITYASYWPGDVPATPESIRAALLTALRRPNSSAGVRRPDGTNVVAENWDEGWRILSWRPECKEDAVAIRSDGQSLLPPARGLDKLLRIKGDFFLFEEAHSSLVEFASGNDSITGIEWQLESEA